MKTTKRTSKIKPGPWYQLTEAESNKLEVAAALEMKKAKSRVQDGVVAEVDIYDARGFLVAKISALDGGRGIAMGTKSRLIAGLELVEKSLADVKRKLRA